MITIALADKRQGPAIRYPIPKGNTSAKKRRINQNIYAPWSNVEMHWELKGYLYGAHDQFTGSGF